MKTLQRTLVFLITALGGAPMLAQHDARTLNGVTVDLAPVHQWFRTKDRSEERPMRHWQMLRIIGYTGPLMGGAICQVRSEDGAESEILLAHLPAQIRTAFEKLNAATAELEALKEEIQACESQLAMGLPANRAGAAQAARLRAILAADRPRLRLLQSQVGLSSFRSTEMPSAGTSSFESTTGTLSAEVARVTRSPILAMYTGRQYGNRPVWDTGILSAGPTCQ